VSKDVVWKDLGLMIIDEEQKFGVNVKDKPRVARSASLRWRDLQPHPSC
jgi:transcription-repair coupling factor (superfamily II helicase)